MVRTNYESYYKNVKFIYFSLYYYICSIMIKYQFLLATYIAPTILAVMDATVDITNWSTLALLLGLSLADFDRIVANEHEASGQQMGIIRKWIDSGTASWAVLVTALKNVLVGKQAVANAIAKKYPKSEYCCLSVHQAR